MTAVSIDEWVIRAKNGIEEAMSFLYLNYYPKIYRYLYFRVGNPKTAEDLTSDVFLKMIQALPHYRIQNVPFQAWLFQIARNLAIDHYRKQVLHPIVEIPEEMRDGFQPVDTALEVKMTHESLSQALENLTEDQRDVILLRFIEGMSLYQVGQVLHKSEDSIKGLQHRALISLRNELAHQEVGYDSIG